jgi:uncharacterized protein (TIGR02246 family)
MRSMFVALLVVTMAASGTAQKKHRPAEGQPQSREAADQAGIRKLQERDIAASTAFDVDALLALWTEDGVLLAPGQAPISGKDNLRTFYERNRDAVANTEILAYEEQWQEVRIMGDYAYQWGQIRSRRRTGQSKQETSDVVNAMRVLKRGEDGSWRVARAIYNEARTGTSVGSETIPEGERR